MPQQVLARHADGHAPVEQRLLRLMPCNPVKLASLPERLPLAQGLQQSPEVQHYMTAETMFPWCMNRALPGSQSLWQ